MYSKILVAVDGSDPSKDALKSAGALSTALSAELHLVHVPQGVSHVLVAGAGSIAMPPSPQELAEAGAAVLDGAQLDAEAAGVSLASSELVDGDPGHAIVNHAEKLGADLIIMGRRGLGDFAGLLVGSVTHKVSQLAPCAVLTVK
ncbi:MAG: universal stress protein [Pseudomonadota bacterium]